MLSWTTSLFWLLSICVIVESQKFITERNDALQCAAIIKSCQSQCVSHSNKYGGPYVRWLVDLRSRLLSCKRYNATKVQVQHSENTPVVFTFDVFCCDKDIPQQRMSPSLRSNGGLQQEIKCIDQKKLDTLFVLGVATLGSISLMCVFVFLGLILYKRRTRYYKYQQPTNVEENQSLVKESEKNTSAYITMTDFGNNKSGCSSPDKSTETPPKYFTAKTTSSNSSRSSKSEPESRYVNGDVIVSNNPTILKGNNISQGCLVPTIITSKEALAEGSDKQTELNEAKRLPDRVEVAGEYEIRGGFIRPINRNVEPRSMKFLTSVEPENKQEQTTEPVISLSEMTFQTPAIKSKSNGAVEDPYVQAPPLKSLRSQPKTEEDPYQKLIPSSSTQKYETGDYNMLLHNSTAGNNSDAKQFLILNNNSKPSACSSGDKSEVILKSAPSSTPMAVGVAS